MTSEKPNSYAKISIILPVYRQADHIAKVVQSYQDAMSTITIPIEIVLIPNGGDGATEQACENLANDATVKSFPLQSGGWGLAVREGLKNATGDLICYTNSSRTAPEDLTLLLLYAIANPNAAIKANRKIRESLKRRLGSLIYNLEARSIYDLPMWDINGTPKVFPRRFDKLLNLERDDDLIDLEFNVVCRQNDYPVLEVPILSTKRHGGTSTTGLKTAVRLYTGAWKLRHTLGSSS